MNLNDKITENLRDNLGKNLGGGLHIKSADAQLIDTPILAIGLGGTGADSLIRLKHMVNERLNSDFNNEKPTNIEYLVLDTDQRIKPTQYKGTKFSESHSEVYIMEDAMLSQTYANLGSNQMPHVNEWISRDINVAHITNGAGGIRQIGRFLFFKEFQNVINILKKKITKITQGRSNKKKIYVFIATGVSGGTGSGTFIDIPYILRNIFFEMGFSIQILGFIFLPDVNIQTLPYEDDATRRNIQRNGFAALKELDYLMNLGNGGNGEKFEQNYGGGFKVSYSQAPYDICHLVSSINQNGVNQMTKENCMAVTAETIINFIADEPNVGNQQFSIAQYLSNIVTNSSAFISGIATKLPINYKYNAIGSSSGVLPMDDVLNYLTHLLFKNMQELYTKTPTNNDVMDLIEQLKIGINTVEISLRNNITLRDIDLYKYDAIKNDPTIIEKVLSENIQNNLIDIMDKNLERFIADFNENSNKKINGLFTDLEKGPGYASRIINSTEDFCVLKYIKEQRDNQLISVKINDSEIGRYKNNMIMARKKIIESKPLLGFNKDGMVKDYKKACNDYFSVVLQNIIIDKMSYCYDLIENILNENNNKVFNVLTEMISVMRNIFNDYAGIANEVKLDVENDETVFTWDIIDASVLVSQVQFLIANDTDFKISFKQVISNFVTELIKNSADWLNDIKPNASLKLNEFIVNNFNQIANQSIDFYIKKLAEEDEKKEQNFISGIMQSLGDNSKVMFPLSIYGDTLKTPIYKYFSIPYNTEIFNNHLTGIGTVKKSIITNRIFMLNVNLAYPLMAYRELESYESIYETFTGREGIGMHLYEAENNNWINLPSPIYQMAWSVGYENARQKKINEQFKNIFIKAIEFGYIVFDEDKAQYLCSYSNGKIDLDKILKNNGLDANLEAAKKSDIQKTLTILKGLLKDGQRTSEKVYLYDINYDKKTNELELEYSIGIFINMPKLNKNITKMVKEHENILELISELESKSKGFIIYPQFAACLYTEIIKKERANYKFMDQSQFQKTIFTISPTISDNYYEYYLFNAFLNLTKQEKDYLCLKAEKNTNQADDQTLDNYIDIAKKYLEDFAQKRTELATTYDSIEDGLKKAEFYTELRDEMQKIIKLYSN